jgi:hypothetical protein
VSKAFTRESDDESSAEEISSFRPQLPPGTRNYITREGADRLKQRLSDLLEMKQALAARRNEAGRRREPTSGRSNRPPANFSRYWIHWSSRMFLLIRRKSRLVPPSSSGTGTGRKRHTILWGLRKRTPNARRSVGFRRWRARSSRGDRVIRCGFNPQQGVRN